MVNKFRRYGIFLILPGVSLVYSILLRAAAGPFWLAPNFDPSYQYLINGLYLAKGIVPNHTDHPGTPLQLLCCAICWLFNTGRSVEDMVAHVLTAPEFYLQVVFVIVSLFSCVTSLALAVYVYRKTSDRVAALLTQLPALIFLTLKSWETFEPVLPVVANISPEPLLIGILNLFNLVVLMNFFTKTSKDESITTLWWGFVSGLGVAVKITFIPVLAVPLIVLSWRNKAIFIGVFVASFVLWTLPILSKYHIIWGWISGIAVSKGDHGSAGGGIGKILSYALGWKEIMGAQAVFVIFLCAAVILAIWKLAGKKWDKGTSFFAAISAGIFFQFSAVTQHPGAHYLLPGLGLFSALLCLFYWQSVALNVLGRKIVFVLILIGAFLGTWQANEYRLKLEGLTQDILAFHDHISSEYQNCIFIDYYRSSDPQAALFFGDGWNLSPHLGQDLFRLYPNRFYFNVWGHHILNFDGTVWSNDLLAQHPCVLFRGDGNFDFSHGPYEVRLLEKGRFESIHRLTGTTEKQAAIMLAGAMQFFQTGDYSKSLMCLLQARKFHYQPDSTVESILALLKPYLQR